MKIPKGFIASYFQDIPLPIKAVPDPGYVFIKWLETGDKNPEINFIGTENSSLTPVFAPAYPFISEIHYHPNGGEAFEFIELYNAMESDLDIGGFQLANAIQFTFPQGTTIDPGSYVIVAKDASHYQSLSCQVFQWDSGELDNEGETILLLERSGAEVDRISYSSATPWPNEPNGLGPSLSLKSLLLDNEFPENWEPYFVEGGSPCGEKSPVPDLLEEEEFTISVFPVPVQNTLFFTYASVTERPVRIQVFNHAGQLVEEIALESAPFMRTKEVSIAHWSDGIYTLRQRGNPGSPWQKRIAKIAR